MDVPSTASATTPPTILIVDDDPLVGSLLVRMVSRIVPPVCVRTYERPAEALAQLRSAGAQLLITDYHLPEMHGIALAQAAKHLVPALHVLLVTASPTPELMRRATDAGIVEVLAKPFAFAYVLERIQALLAAPTLPAAADGAIEREHGA